MSKIDELINQLCPNGVTYYELRELFKISRGRVMSKEYLRDNAGNYPVYSSQTVNNGQIGKIATFDFDGEYLTWTTDGANAGTIFYRNGKFSVTNVCGLLKATSNKIDPKFAYYILSVNMKNYVSSGMGNPKLMSNVAEKIKIPIPPIAIQEEIVKILDTFTTLEAELEAELEARKKQYIFYRDSLLSFEGKDVEWKKLGDLTSLITKGTTPKTYSQSGVSFVKTESFDGTQIDRSRLSYVDDHTHRTFLKRSILEKDDILITIAGATIGKVVIVPEEILPANTNQALAIIRLNKDVNTKFVFYIMRSNYMINYINQSVKGSAQPNLNLQQLNDFMVPIPNPNEQERIVKILDKFNAIVNDISIGLPAEINSRRKQYEYYRNQLLTFNSVSNE